MKTVLFGGSFDPLHIGHLHLADVLKREYGFQQVILVPSYVAPHKGEKWTASPQMRYEMVKAAAEPEGFIVEPFEISNRGVSYTFRTVEYIYSAYSVSGKLSMVIGDDLVEGLPSWKDWKGLIEQIDLLIARRSESETPFCPWPHTYLDNAILPISSSDIRHRVEEARAFHFLIPKAVAEYIESEDLYRRTQE
jgi:nicotinate-nucleotide adenylyltransferase